VPSVITGAIGSSAQAYSVFIFVLDEVPKYPVPTVNPYGLRISEEYFSWNAFTAAIVAVP